MLTCKLALCYRGCEQANTSAFAAKLHRAYCVKAEGRESACMGYILGQMQDAKCQVVEVTPGNGQHLKILKGKQWGSSFILKGNEQHLAILDG